LVVVLAIPLLNSIKLSTYLISPGEAQPVGPLIHVVGLDSERHDDKIMLTDVFLTQLSAWTWITSHFKGQVEYVQQGQLLPSNVSTDQLEAQGFVDMDQSKDAAKVAALQALGWHIPIARAGATVYAVYSDGGAAKSGLAVGDEIVGVNNSTVTTLCDFVKLTGQRQPGTVVTVSARPAVISSTGAIALGRPKAFKVTLQAPPPNTGVPDCPGVHTASTTVAGLFLEDAFSYTFPGHIAISTPDIGGPSAGLAMTLALMDRLSDGSLTGHVAIAATGTIDPSGNVGDVGGVPEKTVAVEHAGARIFIVPEDEAASARSASDGHIKIVGVTTLAQALSELRHLGGDAPIPLTAPYPLKAAT
jgi:PDZ domain-containing protein